MNSITIDSTQCISNLCEICAESCTDKGPFTPPPGHRHPYSTPYSLFFEPLRNKPIKFMEIGIFSGASILAWRRFFTKARIYGFDIDMAAMQNAKNMNLPDVILDRMDAGSTEDMNAVFEKYTADGELFDVVIDDALHEVEQQAVTIRNALKYVKQGGLLIIEDIFRDKDHSPYVALLEEMKDLISFSTFIVCDHQNRWSPGWNNDELLVIVRA